MDVLILSCSTGGGHDSAGHTIMNELISRGHHVTMLNPYKLKSDRIASSIDHTYVSIAKKAPSLFGAIYQMGQLYRRLPFRSPVYFANGGMATIVQNYLESHHFDILIMTHLFPAEIITNLKQRSIHVPPTMFIATDYSCIPFTEETNCDAYVIPSVELIQEFVGRGIPKNTIYPLGIPVDRKFSGDETQEEARERLKLSSDKKYILVAGGSMGGGKMKRAVNCLMSGLKNRADTELIILCGHNTKLLKKLGSSQVVNSTILNYTDDMAGYMRASDIFVSKPGGLSSTEAAVSGIPILHTAAIPGCESYNARFFDKHGISRLCATSKSSILHALEELENPAFYESMLRNQRNVIAADAAIKICLLAENIAT